ncbi:MAG TPA: alpha-L-fucosidase [Planctomycetota bacterium]|nr:alpha-L-fucosidase [Planctomycetota bacterium]
MARSWIAAAALLVVCSCGGGGDAPAPSVRSSHDEVQGRRDEIKSAGEAPAESSSEILRLLQAMDDPDPEVRWRSEFALGRVGPRGLRALASALRNDRPQIRRAAAFVLGPHGRKAREAIPALVDALADPEEGVRIWTAHALGEIDPEDSRALSALTKSLRDTSPDVRRVLVMTVIRLGPQAAGAATPLIDLLQDADAGIRALACAAFREIGPGARAAIPALIARLADPDADVQGGAEQALIRIGPDGVAPVARALKERDPGVRRAAARILGALGGESRSASAELADATRDGDPGVQTAAAEAIQKIQNDTGDVPVVRGTSFVEAPEVVGRRSAGYRWAKFGLFMNWGLYSVAARAKPGQRAEQVLENEKLPLKEYEQLISRFRAGDGKPEEWAKLANETGARYLVMPAKSSDGFCLWNSKQTDYSSPRLAPGRRDLVGDFAAACAKEGVKFCVSYSLLDRHHPDYRDKFPTYVDFVHEQVKELLSTYPIWGLWFDEETGHTLDEWRGSELVSLIRRAKPTALVNDRLGRDTRGTITRIDFYTKEPDLGAAALRLQGRPVAWEFRQTIGDSGSYNESPDPQKSGERLILDLVEVVSKGGNFLLQVGPKADGTIPDPVRARLKVIGGWLEKNGDSIYDTERSPFGGPIPAGRVSSKGTRLFVFLEEPPRDGLITLPGLKTKVREAWVLDGKRELKVRDTGIQAPDLIEGSPVTVVAIELEGPPEVSR